MPALDVKNQLDVGRLVDLESDSNGMGLSDSEAREAIAKYGFNEIKEEARNPYSGVLRRLWGPIPWTLEAALLVEILLGKILQASVITILLLFSAVVGETQERRSQKVVNLLKQRLQVSVRVLRNGIWKFLFARELAPGDLIHVKVGDIVPADCRIRTGSVEVDQSSLTGESESVSRAVNDTIYSGSVVRTGESIAVVTATGPRSFFGKTAELVKTASSPGHLQRLLLAVVRYLAMIDVVLIAVLLIAALVDHYELLPLLPFLVVLVIATVPVAMPASFTVANAIEARALAKEGVLVTGLTAIQESANLEVLCVDKTGTLTQNKPSIASICSFTHDSENQILAYAAAAADASSKNPIDIAILEELTKRSIEALVREEVIPFDPVKKFAEAQVRQNGEALRVMLGSPFVLEEYASAVSHFKETIATMAANGGRVLAVAVGPEELVTVRGLISFHDLPREDAASLVQTIRGLGIRLLMITGDTPATAQVIGRKINLGDRIGTLSDALRSPLDYDGIANVYPEEKYRIIQALQRQHLITGMTGDGINDAPALKQAEVGIAVSSATDVAKASAKVVITNPGLQDIVKIIYGGRRVYRRMLTWTITKITRTIELAVLLTFGYLLTGDFVIPLSLIVLVIVFNDLVTITLGTDRAWISPVPERWNVKGISQFAAILAAGWLIIAFAMLWFALKKMNLSFSEVQTLMFIYLIYSAQATIYITRVRGRFWSFLPSHLVVSVTLGNVIVSSVLAMSGIFMAALSPVLVLGVVLLVVVTGFILDEVKILLFNRSRRFVSG